MQDLSQNIPYVPHAPLTNGVFLQQNQFPPKICGSLQICACDHNLLFILIVYLQCICIYIEQLNIYPWFLRIWTLISGSSLPNVFLLKNESWFTDCSKETCQQTLSCSSLFYNFSDFDDNWGLTTERMNSSNL